MICEESYNNTDRAYIKFTATHTEEVLLCPCKKSDNLPYCDGTHTKHKKQKLYFLLDARENSRIKTLKTEDYHI